MKFEDLNNVEIGDILTCKDLGATFKVTDIDMGLVLPRFGLI